MKILTILLRSDDIKEKSKNPNKGYPFKYHTLYKHYKQ